MWFGRLGGTNLFDAVLPESISAVDSSKAIGDATKVARWFLALTLVVLASASRLAALLCLLALLAPATAVPAMPARTRCRSSPWVRCRP